MSIQTFNYINQQKPEIKSAKPKKITDKFETYLKNSADINDCI